MNLKELREAMASDATKENEELKRKLKSLQKKYDRESREMSEEIEALKSDCRALGNRCFVLTHGSMCMFCELRTMECQHALSFDDKIKSIEKIRRECEKENKNA